MKKLYFLVVVLFVMVSVKGQNPDDVIYIPDPFLNEILISSGFTFYPIGLNANQNPIVIDTNSDDQIQVSEALQVYYLFIDDYPITDLTGLEAFTNLKSLRLYHNDMLTIDISAISSLKEFVCSPCELEILNTGNVDLTSLYLSQTNVTTLDLSAMPSLGLISLSDTPLTALDLSNQSLLKFFYCSNTNITGLDFTNSPLMKNLQVYNNQLITLEIPNCTMLEVLLTYNNQLTSLDLSACTELETLNCKNNLLTVLDITNNIKIDPNYLSVLQNPFERLFIKNGRYYPYIFYGNYNLQNLEYICADENRISQYKSLLNTYSAGVEYEINSYCSFVPGGIFYNINGATILDYNNNGCDNLDLPINLKYNITSDSQVGSFVSNTAAGSYSIPVAQGTHVVTPFLENPSVFTVSPSSVTAMFPFNESPFTQNFCITPNGIHPDLEVVVLPTNPARPGFDAHYKIIIKNKGNIQQSGSANFIYNDAVLDYVIANPVSTTQASGSLTWDFTNLEPFETREINVTLNVNTPMETPAVNGGDVLTYNATITSDQVDDLPLDNIFSLPQIVVNSFDPNDKTCLEGTAITPDMIGQYVHYMIRFENTGTFAAQNIVVKDMIDETKFDVSSLIALNGSHSYVTRITGNKVEFIFENINLPFDDANNDGYVVFKIKTLPTLVLGDSFSNSASIYFDYNFPIVTDPAVTTFAVLGTEDFEFNNYFALYPNPTNGVLNITSKQTIGLQSISIYNTLGQMVVSVPNAKGISSVDVSGLATGNYFIKIVSDKGTSNAKFIKQ